jgi:hypothetical protein
MDVDLPENEVIWTYEKSVKNNDLCLLTGEIIYNVDIKEILNK